MFSTASHTPGAGLYEDRNGAVLPTAGILAPNLGRDVETAAAASHNAAVAYLQTWSTSKGRKITSRHSHERINHKLKNINESRAYEVLGN